MISQTSLSESSFNHFNQSSRPTRNRAISTEAEILRYFQSSPSPPAPSPYGRGEKTTEVAGLPTPVGRGAGGEGKGVIIPENFCFTTYFTQIASLPFILSYANQLCLVLQKIL